MGSLQRRHRRGGRYWLPRWTESADGSGGGDFRIPLKQCDRPFLPGLPGIPRIPHAPFGRAIDCRRRCSCGHSFNSGMGGSFPTRVNVWRPARDSAQSARSYIPPLPALRSPALAVYTHLFRGRSQSARANADPRALSHPRCTPATLQPREAPPPGRESPYGRKRTDFSPNRRHGGGYAKSIKWRLSSFPRTSRLGEKALLGSAVSELAHRA